MIAFPQKIGARAISRVNKQTAGIFQFNLKIRNSISFATLKSGEKNIVTEKTNQRENKATDEEKKDLSKFDSSTDRDKANIASDKHF